MSQSVTRLYTAAEFEKMPEFHERYELLDGRLVEKPMPHFKHSEIAWRIQIAYYLFVPDQKLGVIRTDVSVKIDNNYTPVPDLSFWVASRKPDFNVGTAAHPDLAIEVESDGQGLPELLKKAARYLAAGVRLVWIIQPSKQSAVVLRAGQQDYATVQPTGKLEGEDVIPGFEIKLEDLFRD